MSKNLSLSLQQIFRDLNGINAGYIIISKFGKGSLHEDKNSVDYYSSIRKFGKKKYYQRIWNILSSKVTFQNEQLSDQDNRKVGYIN